MLGSRSLVVKLYLELMSYGFQGLQSRPYSTAMEAAVAYYTAWKGTFTNLNRKLVSLWTYCPF